MSKKCYEYVTVHSKYGPQSIRCPKGATKFFRIHTELVQDHLGGHIDLIFGCCDKHARFKMKPESWAGTIRGSIIKIQKSSEQEMVDLDLDRRQAGLLNEFKRMFERKSVKDKSREEILEIFMRALDEHCVKQVLTS
jgi:hypothetical protein